MVWASFAPKTFGGHLRKFEPTLLGAGGLRMDDTPYMVIPDSAPVDAYQG